MGDIYLKGIKYSGGSNVVPNPEGEATDTLSTIGIGDTIFDIAGGGGLFIDTNNVIQAFTPIQDTQEHSYTATEDCAIAYTIAVSANSETFIKVDNAIIGGLYATDTTAINDVVYIKKGQTFSFQQTFTNSPKTGYTVYGIKYGSSGSGGLSSEIIPITAGDDTTTRTFTFDKTPQFIKFYWQDATLDGGWATDGDMLWGQSYMNYRSKRMGATVANVDGGISTITYGADNKSITITGGNAFGAMNSINGSGYMFIDYGSSSGGEGDGYTSTKIWDYVDDNSGVISYGSYTHTLNDNINNYDMLAIENVSASSDLSDANWSSSNLWYVDVNMLNSNINANYITYTSWDQRATRFYIKDTTFQATSNNGANTNGTVRVFGIKFGGGGSGSSQKDITDMTWTQIISQAGGAWSTATAIPSNATHIAVVVDYDNKVYMPQTFKLSDWDKYADTLSHSLVEWGFDWKVGSSYDTIQLEYDSTNKTIKTYAEYRGLTLKTYALS